MPSQRSSCVPGGTPITSGSPSAPCCCAPCPCPPRSARKCARRRNDCRSRSESSTRTSTSPPRPPSPPSGPPLGTCASRRNETEPSPPRPARTSILGAVVEQSRVTVAAWLQNSDPVFLITGASSGIGAATARQAAEAGYRLVARRALDRQDRRARRGARRRRARDRRHLRRHRMGPAAGARQGRARRVRERRRRVRQRRLRRAARLPGERRRPLEGDGAHQRLRRGPRRSGPRWTRWKDSKGHMLLTGSVAGRRAVVGPLDPSTKRAITGRACLLRQEFLNASGVRVTVIEPGMTDTPFFDFAARSLSRCRPTTSPARSCSPCSSRRTWTSTRS